MNQPLLILRFSSGLKPSLTSTEFRSSDRAEVIRAERSQIAKRQFRWTKAVVALCIFLVRYLASSKVASPDRFWTKGPRGTPSASLDDGLDKCADSQWMGDMFGRDPREVPFVHGYVWRLNPGNKKKNTGGFELRVPIEKFPPSSLTIFQGDVELTSLDQLLALLEKLESQWKGKCDDFVLPSGDAAKAFEAAPVPELSAALPCLTAEIITGNHCLLPSPTQISPFRPIEEVGHLFGPPSSLFRSKSIFPTKAEFLNGFVYRCSLFPCVLERLARKAYAVIGGDDATGKTTLALQVAFDRIKAKIPALYLDINEITARHRDQAAVEAMSRAARKRFLLILDNAHVNESLASEICHEWKRRRTDSQLLMVSREVQESGDLAEWLQDCLPLTVEEKDLVGALATIANRCLWPPCRTLNVHPDRVHEWFQAFGGNLVAFTVAATERIEVLNKGDLHLGPEHARAWVQSQYLNPVTSAERQGLLRLAVLGQFEIRVPKLFIGDRLHKSQHDGTVHKILISQPEDLEFTLAHPALGKLLLAAAAKGEVDQLQVLLAFMKQYPERAANTVYTVLVSSEGEPAIDLAKAHAHFGATRVDAKQLFREWLSSPDFRALESVNGSNLFDRLLSAGFTAREPLIDRAFLAQADLVLELSVNVQFELLIEFLNLAETILPQTHALLLRKFRAPQHRRKAVSLLLQSLGWNEEELQRPPKTKTEKFHGWLLDHALNSSDHQAVLNFVWRANLRVACDLLKRLWKAQGAARFTRLLNQSVTCKLAAKAFFNHTAIWSDGKEPSSILSMVDALILIQEQLPAEVRKLYQKILSGPQALSHLHLLLSIASKDDPSLGQFFVLLGKFVKKDGLLKLKSCVGTKSIEDYYPGTTPARNSGSS